MKKVITIIIIISLIAIGVVIYKNHSSENTLSEQGASKIAVEAIINDGRKDWLKLECAQTPTSEKDLSVISFNIHEVHNASCGGDPNTGPRITSVIVNLKTGEVYDQPTQIDTIDQGWRTIKIEGKDYQVTKKLR